MTQYLTKEEALALLDKFKKESNNGNNYVSPHDVTEQLYDRFYPEYTYEYDSKDYHEAAAIDYEIGKFIDDLFNT